MDYHEVLGLLVRKCKHLPENENDIRGEGQLSGVQCSYMQWNLQGARNKSLPSGRGELTGRDSQTDQIQRPTLARVERLKHIFNPQRLRSGKPAVNHDGTIKAVGVGRQPESATGALPPNPGWPVGADNGVTDAYLEALLQQEDCANRWLETSGAVIQNEAVHVDEPGTVPDAHQFPQTLSLQHYVSRLRPATSGRDCQQNCC